MSQLHELAAAWGVAVSYVDALGAQRTASPEVLTAVLRSLGAPLERLADAESALRERTRAVWGKLAEPVSVAWDGREGAIPIHVLEGRESASWRVTLSLAGAEPVRREGRLADLAVVDRRAFGTTQIERRIIPLPELALGYHDAIVEVDGRRVDVLIIAAPRVGHRGDGTKTWGVFAPLYSLHDARRPEMGDFGTLEALFDWVLGQGGGVVGTLPLLPGFLEGERFEPSPYAPVSRLFWNELYIDLAAVPEMVYSSEAQQRLAAISRPQAPSDAGAGYLDYARVYAERRAVLEGLADAFYDGRGSRRDELERYAKQHPDLERYARYRAALAHAARPEFGATLELESPAMEREARFHRYVQMVAGQQLDRLHRKASERGRGLYLDLPLGVHHDGYDVWREGDLFAPDVSAGAPPDPLFRGGQNWGFPPLHPERLRNQHYQYFRDVVAHHARVAGVLRIDHVACLHRLYWIPRDASATEGLYVHGYAEELSAVLTLESHKHECLLVGEDLGTIPDAVRELMRTHALHRTWVLPFEASAQQPAWGEAPHDCVATLNTHDMPPFGRFWKSLDIGDLQDLGLADDALAQRMRDERWALVGALVDEVLRRGLLDPAKREDPRAVLDALCLALADEPAEVVLLTLEDFWLEDLPQNVPGTHTERANWRRRFRRSLEEIFADDSIRAVLAEVARRRRA